MNQKVESPIVGVDKEAYMVTNAKICKKIFSKYNDVFTGIRYFKDTFSLQAKEGRKPYWAPPRDMTYALPELLKRESEKITRTEKMALLGADETKNGAKVVLQYPNQTTLYI